jgi:hypothetical protein
MWSNANGRVDAIALFVHNGHKERVPCSRTGHAVIDIPTRAASCTEISQVNQLFRALSTPQR